MKEKRRQWLMAGIVLVVAVGGLLSLFVAGQRAERDTAEQAGAMLLSIARSQAENVSFLLTGRLELLQGISAALDLDLTAPGNTEARLDELCGQGKLGFSLLGLIGPDGIRFSGQPDKAIDVSDRAYFQASLSGAPAAEFVTGRLTGQPCFILSVPYYRQSRIQAVLWGLYYPEELRQLLTTHAYQESANSLLINSQGEIITSSINETDFSPLTNLFTVLDAAKFTGDSSLDDLRLALSQGDSLVFDYSYQGSSRVAALAPLAGEGLPENDWFVVNLVYGDRLSGEAAASRHNAMASMALFSLFLAVALLLLFLLERGYRRQREAAAELTRQREEQFRIVTEQSGKFVARYQIADHTLIRCESSLSDGLPQTQLCFSNVPESLLTLGNVEPESAQDLRDFFRQLDEGTSPLSTEILLRQADGISRWFKFTATTIFDQKGQPRTAIIAYFDNTDRRERALAYAKWQQELTGHSFDQAALYEWNLTRDRAEGQRGALAVSYSHLPQDTFDLRCADFLQKRVAKADQPAFAALMRREHLLALYLDKTYQCSLDYQYREEAGSLRWRRISVQMVPYPDSQEVKAYVINRDIDREKREELALLAQAQLDYLTGALNRETFTSQVNLLLAEKPAASHALLLLDVDNFKQINDTLGHNQGDQVLSEFVSRIRSVLRSGDLLGRLGGDEFVICLPDIPREAVLDKKAAQLLTALRWQPRQTLSISASIGVAIYSRDGLDFTTLYRRADIALYYTKRRGKNGYACYQPQMEPTETGEDEPV